MVDAQIHEKIGVLTAKVEAAHNRVDTIEQDIKSALHSIDTDLKSLNAHMNKGKGWAASALLVASIFGGAIAAAVIKVFGSLKGA